MARKTKQPSLKELKKTWYKKLKASGFKDIEQDEDNLIDWSYRFTRQNHNVNNNNPSAKPKKIKNKQDDFAAKQDYYYYAAHFLQSYQFSSFLERNIWEYHSNGISIRNIVTILNRLPRTKVNKDSVWKIIKDLSTIMKAQYLK